MPRKAPPRFWLTCCFLLLALPAPARPDFDTSNPLSFFTNVANRFLLTLPPGYDHLSVTNIPLYPTNRYTPAVHRLLQLTANLYDATTNRPETPYPNLPSVFRPIFKSDSSGVFIAGYREETNTAAVSYPCVEAADLAAAPVGTLITSTNVYNVPWIIGAKKGLPNFNEFELLSGIQVARVLEFRRVNLNGDPNDPANPVAYTNQLFRLTVTNWLASEAWNSYSNSWNLAARPLRLLLTNEFSLQITNTNALGFSYATNFITGTNYLVNGSPANIWTGYSAALPRLPPLASFRVPLTNSINVLQANVMNLQSPAGFDDVTNGRDVMSLLAGPYPVPRWQVDLTIRVRYALIDENAGRVLDYVNISQIQNSLDLAWELAGRTNGALLDGTGNGAWYTNGPGGPFPDPPGGPSVGLLNQILFCAGQIPFIPNTYNKETSYGTEFFKYNLYNAGAPSATVYKTNVFISPYAPYRTVYQRITWEVNDPLAHYTVNDLTDFTTANTIYRSDGLKPLVPGIGTISGTAPGISGLNSRYLPWGGGPNGSSDSSTYNLALKDPLLVRPEGWNFPTNKSATLDWLGRVHRGTPWQTLYLKSDDISTDIQTWKKWTGNGDPTDAAVSLPTNDWRLASLLVSLLSPNDPRPLLSVNSPDTNAWLNAFDGLTALTNTSVLVGSNQVPTLSPIILFSNSPAVLLIVDVISQTRTTNFNGRFRQIGDILSVPMLTIGSPFLNTNGDPTDLNINDEAYEKLPSQLLLRLRPDSRGDVTKTNPGLLVRFTGGDGYDYAVEFTSNLVDWSVISTGSPQAGSFQFLMPYPPDHRPHLFRTELLP